MHLYKSPLSAPADLSVGLVVTSHAIAEVLAEWVSVQAEAPLEEATWRR